ncbi:MAG: tetratricopeptide repeat protein [Deltaproteobacteria bacterium]|nr:tetratricopeptide repeat protein [Deltaproteobacteria bacterium]
MERKLTAIFSADVKGYSRLMGDDEEATIHTLTAYREVMTALIQQHRGRVVDSPGDNLLAEFASAVDAVQGAVKIQGELQKRNLELPDERKMQYRIGINVGDVIVEGERLYGDGVNIAARLEGLAEPGGICISGTVYDQVENKLALGYEYVGEQEVKNITKPVRVYRVKGDGETSPTVGAARRGRPFSQPRRVRPVHRWVVAGLALLAVTLGAVRYFSFPAPNPQPPIPSPQSPLSTQDSALRTDAAPAVLPLPDKPSIAVLPFTNMSGDPGQEYFSDGITEDLTTALAKVSALFVIARNSAFVYKGKPVDLKAVSRELGVRYVVEGSVQKADNRVRITAQLVDGSSAAHVWAESYDRELKDIFAVQDEVRQKIVFALKVKLTPEEQERFRRAPTNNLEAYEYLLRGVESLYHGTKEANIQARQMFEKALELDPQYAGAYAWLGVTYWGEWLYQWSQDPQNLERAFELAQRARALDDSLPGAHNLLSGVYGWGKKQPEQAITEAERAIALDPNYADSYAILADVLSNGGRPQDAIGWAEKAIRLDPRGPGAAGYLFELGMAYRLVGREEEAIATYKQALMHDPNLLFAYTDLAWSYVWQWGWQLSQDSQTLEHALAAAQQAIALNDASFWAHSALGIVYLWQKQHDQAIAEAERAIAPEPNQSEGYAWLAETLSFAGRAEEAVGWAEKAMRVGVPDPHWWLPTLGQAYCLTGRYEEAIATLQKFTSRSPNWLHAQLILAIAASEAGRDEEAQVAAAEVLRISPKFSLEVWKERVPYKDPAIIEHMLVALRKAGLK